MNYEQAMFVFKKETQLEDNIMISPLFTPLDSGLNEMMTNEV